MLSRSDHMARTPRGGQEGVRAMIVDTCQRFTLKRETRRPAGEPIQTSAYDVHPEKSARALADDLMARGMAHKPNGAWIVEVNRLKRSPV